MVNPSSGRDPPARPDAQNSPACNEAGVKHDLAWGSARSFDLRRIRTKPRPTYPRAVLLRSIFGPDRRDTRVERLSGVCARWSGAAMAAVGI